MAPSVSVTSQASDFEAVVRQMLLAEHAPAQIPDSCFRPVLSRRLSMPSGTLRLLCDKMRVSMVTPALRSSTREQYMELVRAQWREFVETTEAITVILKSCSPFLMVSDAAEADSELVDAARRLCGEVSAEEIEFGLATCERAFAAAEKLPESMISNEDGRRVLREFRTHVFLHAFGALALKVAGEEVGVTEAGISTSFELFRGGALHAYAVARGALMAQREKEDVPESFEEAPFDEEDMRLVNAG